MEILAIVALAVAVVVCLLLLSQKNELIDKLNADLKKVGDADTYVKWKEQEGDAYKEKTKSEADDYAAKKKAEADKEYEEARKRLDLFVLSKKREAKSFEDQCASLKEELAVLELDSMVGMVNVDPYDSLKSDEVKNRLAMLRSRQDELVKSGEALLVNNYNAKCRPAH